VTVAAQDYDLVAELVRPDAVAVELDLVHPVVTGRVRPWLRLGCTARRSGRRAQMRFRGTWRSRLS
jgi:hypothetical protein